MAAPVAAAGGTDSVVVGTVSTVTAVVGSPVVAGEVPAELVDDVSAGVEADAGLLWLAEEPEWVFPFLAAFAGCPDARLQPANATAPINRAPTQRRMGPTVGRPHESPMSDAASPRSSSSVGSWCPWRSSASSDASGTEPGDRERAPHQSSMTRHGR